MKCKRETDRRKLDRKALESLRMHAVRRILDGESPEELAEVLGLNRATIYRWLNRYHYGGWEALKAKPVPGRPPKLTAEQMAWLSRTIREKNPLQLDFPFALWTLGMIRELIRKRFGVSLSEVSVGRLMRTLGFTPQRPLSRAYEQDPVLVERWKAEEYPKIRRLARKENALIFFADEASVRSDCHSGRSWAPKGETPVVERTGARFSLNMISAVSPRGEFRFMVHEGTATADTFCEFLRRLATNVDRKIFLIVDRHRIHRARKVQALLKEMKGKIRIFYLPPYAPHLNPDELVWAQVKGRIGRKVVRTKEELKSLVAAALRALQRMPEKVKSFFRAPDCRYAME